MTDVIRFTLLWWGLFFLISLAFFPLAKLFFTKTVDSGWIAAKVLGLLVTAYVVYLLGVSHLLKFTTLNTWLVFGALAAGLYLLVYLKKISLQPIPVKKIFVLELVFFGMLLLMNIIRSYQPQIQSLEKYMDYGFINSILHSDYFPPRDMWWAGGFINYYYLGHLWVAMTAKMSTIPPGVVYNLALSLCFALSGTLLITFLWSWTGRVWAGVLAAFMHLGIGNLHFITTIWKTNWDTYWYPSASRLISDGKVITEFPVYSFVVYDLHAHVLNFAPNLLIIGLLGEIYRRRQFRLIDGLMVGFLLGANFISNAWDLPIYFMVFGLTMVTMVWLGVRSKNGVKKLIQDVGVTLVVAGLVLLPFYLFLEKVSLPVLPTSQHSALYHLFQLWGFWLFLAASLGIFMYKTRKRYEYFDYFIVVLFVSAIMLIIIPEFVYVKDIYGEEYHRANTVFKLTFQSWNLFAFAGAYTVWRILGDGVRIRKMGVKRGVWGLVVVGLLLGCFAYTVRAYKSGYGDFKIFQGLDGEKFLANQYTLAEVEALNWVKKNTPASSVVVEAAGDSYTDYGRVSVFTGRSTIVGWAVHEWLWRGKGFDPVGKRQVEVQTLYTTESETAFQEVVSKYGVDYIYLSQLERSKYLNTPGPVLASKRIVFQNQGVTIYQPN